MKILCGSRLEIVEIVRYWWDDFIGLRVGRKRRKEEYMNNSKGHVVREEY